MANRPQQTPLVQSLPATVPFVGPETQERARGHVFRARIGANESGFGPSPAVAAAMARAGADMWKYCDPENHDLKAALAAHLGIPQANVVVGEGIDGLLGLIVRMYLNPGDAVVTSLGAYPTFNFHVAGFGGRLVTVPYADDREDLDALARGRAPRERSAGLLVQSRQSDGHLVGGRRNHALHRGNARDDNAGAGRSLRRNRASVGDPAARPRPAQRHQDAHLFKGLRPGWVALRLCHRRDRNDRRLRQGAQPFRRQQDGAGRRASGARRPGLSCARWWSGSPPAANGSPRSPAATDLPRSPRRPIS